jgi:hypothetical protein
VKIRKLFLLLLVIAVLSFSGFSQEKATNVTVQYIQSYTTPSADGVLYLYNIKLVWKIVDCSLFLQKYTGIDFYKKILEIDSKIALLNTMILYQSKEIEKIIPAIPSVQSTKEYKKLQETLLKTIEYKGAEKKEPSIELVSIDIVRAVLE